MNRPNFMPDEAYLIRTYQRPHREIVGDMIWVDLGYLVPICLFTGFGFFTDSGVMLVIGFLLLLFFKLSEMWRGRRYAAAFSGIIAKYEACLNTE